MREKEGELYESKSESPLESRVTATTEKKRKTYFPKVNDEMKPTLGVDTTKVEPNTEPESRTKRLIREMRNNTTHVESLDAFEDDNEVEMGLENGRDFNISCIELAIINRFLTDVLLKGFDGITVNSYGTTTGTGRLTYGGDLNVTKGWWYDVTIEGDSNDYIFQTMSHLDRYDRLQTYLSISSKEGILFDTFKEMFDEFKLIAFNNSAYQGKCIEVEIIDGVFQGIDILDLGNVVHNLILTETQERYVNHFIKRVGRGKTARVLFNGIPGTGKTESIRKINAALMPHATFIIPRFNNINDLRMVLETCEVFTNGVVIMDDIDLFIGSRDKGNYTNLLGEFLSFFDGVKKRKISLLASTNDKTLVDKAAERPGRFNFIIDFEYLNKEQTIAICEMHLDKKWQLEEVYAALTGNIDGKSMRVTGAFISNLSENIREMSEDADEDGDIWSLEDTLSLIVSSYKGFYSSQVSNRNGSVSLVK
tara:strand:- start:13511 stop:14947 length:1437 start_codon:yes stop_codon:yes gene_type:complete